jgi:hypothetical protein
VEFLDPALDARRRELLDGAAQGPGRIIALQGGDRVRKFPAARVAQQPGEGVARHAQQQGVAAGFQIDRLVLQHGAIDDDVQPIGGA